MVFVFAPWRNNRAEWTAAFPGWTLEALPVAGRPLIEHQLDWAAGCGATKVIVLDYGYDDVLNEILTGDGRQRWPFALSYRRTEPLASEEEVRLWFAENESDIVPNRIVVGPQFPYKGELRLIESLADYADVNFKVLSDPGTCTPAGYSSEQGVYLGMNVVIKTGHTIERPVCLGDNVLVEFGSQLNGRVIIGENAIVDGGAVLEESIVFPETYIGTKMELRRKIVAGNRVVDIDTGEWVDIEELGMCGYIGGTGLRSFVKRRWRRLFSRKKAQGGGLASKVTIVRLSFTGNEDAAADALLVSALPRIRAAVEAFISAGGAAKRIIGVAMGGGYGRGEGGVKDGHLCNDVDFYTVVDEKTTAEEMQEIARGLEALAAPFTAELGAEVEFSYPKKPSRVWHDRHRVMIQELIRGNVPITGLNFSTLAPEFPAAELPPGEAARTLMNRGMGLLYAAERMDGEGRVKEADAAFVLRNINKAILGAGDALLIARGEYDWSIRERARRVGTAAYEQAMNEKFAPTMALPPDVRPLWRTALEGWRQAKDELFAQHGKVLRSRHLWEAARWLERRRTVGDLGTFGMDCTVRVLEVIARELEQEHPASTAALRRDWQVFN